MEIPSPKKSPPQSKKENCQENNAKVFFSLSKLQPPHSKILSSSKTNNLNSITVHMERPNQSSFILFFSAIIASGLVYFTLCLAAEFKKSKINDLRFDGKFCYLPRSSAFELGIAALILLSTTQVIANLFICREFHSRRGCKVKKPSISCILLCFSWISFGLSVVLMSGATSMNQDQSPGEGWLDGDCYLVKDGVFVGSAFLGLLALGSTLGSVAIVTGQRQAEENRKIHVQIDH